MDGQSGPNIGQLMASGAIGDAGGHVRSGDGMSAAGGGGGMGMMPFGDKGVDIGCGNVGSVFGALHKSFEDSFDWMKAGANALGATVNDVMGRINNYLFAQEAGGEGALKIDGLSIGEVASHGFGVHGDAQLKHLSFKGSDGGQLAG